VLAYDAGSRTAHRPGEPTYWADEILPHALMTPHRDVAWAVAELRSPRGELWLLIVDLGQTEGYVYESLRHLFESAVEGARLMQELSAARAGRDGPTDRV